VARDHGIMAVTDADARLEQVSRVELAAAHVLRLRQAIAAYRSARTPAAIWRATVTTAAATVVLIVAVALVVWFWRWLDRQLRRRLQARIHTVGIQSFEVMRADKIWNALRTGLFALRTILFVAMGIVYLGFTLARWPATRALSRHVV